MPILHSPVPCTTQPILATKILFFTLYTNLTSLLLSGVTVSDSDDDSDWLSNGNCEQYFGWFQGKSWSRTENWRLSSSGRKATHYISSSVFVVRQVNLGMFWPSLCASCLVSKHLLSEPLSRRVFSQRWG